MGWETSLEEASPLSRIQKAGHSCSHPAEAPKGRHDIPTRLCSAWRTHRREEMRGSLLHQSLRGGRRQRGALLQIKAQPQGTEMGNVSQGHTRGSRLSRVHRTMPVRLSSKRMTSFFLGPQPAAYGGSQARRCNRAVATNLHQSHSNTGATATPDPSCACDLHHSAWHRQILNPLSEARDRTCVFMDRFRLVCAEP